MTRRVKRQIATLLLVTQLAFALFAPLAPLAHLIPQALANDSFETVTDSKTFLSFSSEDSDHANQLVVKTSSSGVEALPYALYYLYDQTTQAVHGELVANSENVLFIGTQSADDFINHNWQKMVFKVQVGDVVRSYYLHKQADGELVGNSFETDSVELSQEDAQWISWFTEAESKTATTVESVVEGKEYSFPFNDKVLVKFNKLPDETSPLTIRQIELSGQMAEQFGTELAFDITTEMENGTFEFDLNLPKPEGLDETETQLEVIYADTESDLADETKVSKLEAEQVVGVDEEKGVVKVEGVEHMTVFVVVPGDIVEATNDSAQKTGWRIVSFGNGFAGLVKIGNYGISNSEFGETSIGLKTGSGNDKGFVGYFAPKLTFQSVEGISWSQYSFSTDDNLSLRIYLAEKPDSKAEAYVEVSSSGSMGEWAKNSLVSESKVDLYLKKGENFELKESGVILSDLMDKFEGWTIINFPQTGESEKSMAGGIVFVAESEKNDKKPSEGLISAVELKPEEVKIVKIDYIIDGITLNLNGESTFFDFTDSSEIISTLEVPQLISPKNNSFVQGTSLTSDWSDVEGAVKYLYESYHDEETNNLRWREEYPISQKTATNVSDATFWWRVKAIDAEGNQSGWSDLWKVTVDNSPPAMPTNLTRFSKDGSVEYQCNAVTTLQTLIPNWSDVSLDDPSFSHYEYSSFNVGGITGIDKQPVYTNKFVHNWIPTIEGTYGFAVRSVDKAGNKSSWALSNTDEISLNDSCKITYDSTKPTTPQMLGFKNPNLSCGAVTNSGVVTVDWSDSEDVSIVGYNYQINYPKPDGSRGIWNAFFTTSEYRGSLNEGTHYIKVQAKDAAGNLSGWSEVCEITKDTIAPTITLLSPKDNYYTNQTTVRQEWESSEDNIDHYDYRSCSNKPESNDDCVEIYSTTRDLPWREVNNNNIAFWWQVRGVDLAGNVGDWSEARKITIDTIAPTVDITSHSNSDLVKGIVNITGRIEDTNLWRYWFVIEDSNGVRVGGLNTVNDDGPIVDLNYAWDTTGLNDGEYTIKLEARDKANNKDAGSIDWVTVVVDNTHPTISNINMYVNGEESRLAKSGDTIKVSVEAQDPAGVEKIQLWFRNSKPSRELLKTGYMDYDVEKDLYIFEFEVPDTYDNGVSINEEDRGNYFTFRTYDSLGNYGYRGGATYFTIDNILPSSVITTYSLNNGETTYTNEWQSLISGTATDALSGIDKVFLTIKRDVGGVITFWNGSDWQPGEVSNETTASYITEFTDATWSYDIGKQTQGVYTFTSKALDRAGNLESTFEITVVFDKTIPEVNLTVDPTNPDGSGSWYITKPTLTMKATDPSNSGLDHLQYQWNSQSESGWTTVNANGTNSAIASTQPPKEGHSILYYRATDLAGNTFSDTGVKNIYWDATDLTEGPLNVKANPNPTSGSTSTISWTKAEDNIGIAKYKVTWDLRDGDDDHSKDVSGNTTELKISDLKEGTYKVTVTAYDNAGHKKSASTNLVVNRTAPATPTLTLVSTGTGTATLSWNEVENATDYIILYGTESGNYQYAARVGNVTQYTVEGLTAGSYFFVVRAVDKVDNQSGNSNEVNTGAILGAIGAAGPAVGFVEAGDVLGDQTDQEPTEEEMERAKAEAENGAVLGEMITCNPVKALLPWIILVLQFIILLGVEIVMKRDSSAVKMVIALGTTIVAIALYYLLRSNSCYADGSLAMIVNRFFWLVSGLLSVVIRFLGYGFIEVVEKD